MPRGRKRARGVEGRDENKDEELVVREDEMVELKSEIRRKRGARDDEHNEENTLMRSRGCSVEEGNLDTRKGPAASRRPQNESHIEDSDKERSEGDQEGSQLEFLYTQEEPEKWDKSSSIGLNATQKESHLGKEADEAIVENLVKDCARYILLVGSKEKPIKKSALIKELMSKYPRLAPYVMSEAGKRLQKTLGLRVKGTPAYRKHDPKTWQKKGKGQWYLINDLCTQRDHLSHLSTIYGTTSSSYVAARGFLMVVLSLVHAQNDKRIQENKLFQYFKQLDERFDQVSDQLYIEGLGPPQELISEFEKKHYLTKEVINNRSQEPSVEYTWGPRAYVEIGRRQVIKFMHESANKPIGDAFDRLSDEDDADEENEISGQEENEEEIKTGCESGSAKN
eukprot:334031_1